MSNFNVKVIYSLKLHIQLQKMGFEYITQMKNPNNEKLYCWTYEATPEFIDAFKSIVEGGAYGKK